MEPRTVKLRTPIEFGSETITEITFRPPTGKDMRRLRFEDGYELDAIMTLAGRLGGKPDPVIDKLTGEDLAEVIEIVGRFFPRGQGTTAAP